MRWRPTNKSTRPSLPRLFSSNSTSQMSRARRSPLVRNPSRARILSGRKRSPWIEAGRCPSFAPVISRCDASSHASSSQPCKSTVSEGRSNIADSRPRSSSTNANSATEFRLALVGTAVSSPASRSFNCRSSSMFIASAGLVLSNCL